MMGESPDFSPGSKPAEEYSVSLGYNPVGATFTPPTLKKIVLFLGITSRSPELYRIRPVEDL